MMSFDADEDFQPLSIKTQELDDDDFVKDLLEKDIEPGDDMDSACSGKYFSELDRNHEYKDSFDIMFAKTDEDNAHRHAHRQGPHKKEPQPSTPDVFCRRPSSDPHNFEPLSYASSYEEGTLRECELLNCIPNDMYLPPMSFSSQYHRRHYATAKEQGIGNRRFPRYECSSVARKRPPDDERSVEGRIKDGVLISSLLDASDRKLVTEFTNSVVNEMQVTSFSRRDKKGKRSSFPNGYPGISCRHCDGRIGRTGRYFPSSIKTISDSKKSLYAMHKHINSCVKCPDEVKHKVDSLFSEHVESRKANKRQGTQRAFFRKIWQTLHPVDYMNLRE